MTRLLRPFFMPVLTALVLAAIFVRGVLPAGFMPDSYTLVICTETGAKNIVLLVDETNGPVKHTKQNAPCVFSVTDTPVFSLFAVAVKTMQVWEEKVPPPFTYAFFIPDASYRLPFAQGPPEWL